MWGEEDAAMVSAAPVQVQSDVPVRMRDGVIPRADVYRPTGTGPYPVLLTRTPYGTAALPMTVETNRALAARRVPNPDTVMRTCGGALALLHHASPRSERRWYPHVASLVFGQGGAECRPSRAVRQSATTRPGTCPGFSGVARIGLRAACRTAPA